LPTVPGPSRGPFPFFEAILHPQTEEAPARPRGRLGLIGGGKLQYEKLSFCVAFGAMPTSHRDSIRIQEDTAHARHPP